VKAALPSAYAIWSDFAVRQGVKDSARQPITENDLQTGRYASRPLEVTVMRVLVLGLLLQAACSACAAQSFPCLLAPVELAPVLGHTPAPGKAETDPLGNPMCIYERADQLGNRFLLRVERQPWDRKRYEQRLSLATGSGLRNAVNFEGVGDSAFYVEGAAGALSGSRYVEISGFKAAATRKVQPEEARELLRLVVARLPK
jgi:hypothetical protein